MSRFRLVRRGRTASGSSIAYDTSIGNGVDSLGFANLPLRTVATDGPDLASGAPTTGTNTTYDAPSRTSTTSFVGSGTIIRWNGILTVGQQYRIQVAYNQTTTGSLVIQDGSGTTQATLQVSTGFAVKGYADAVFTATGTDVVFVPVGDGFAGTITMQKICTNSGGVNGHRFFVDPTSGSDSHNGIEAQNHTTPLASIAEALKFVAVGRGDQILVAEASTHATLPNFIGKGGYSATYPLVVQTYDLTDALNEAKYGRATGTNRMVVTDPSGSGIQGAQGLLYIALRGIDFNPGNVPDVAYGFGGGTGAPFDYILIENCRFYYTTLSVDMSQATSQAQKVIVRNSMHYASYTQTEGARPSNIFFDNVRFTYEDCVNDHAGWKPGASRDDDITAGGLVSSTAGPVGYFMHPFYQTAHSDGIVRRCLISNGAGDSGSWRGDIEFTNNLIIDCPIGLGFNSGDNQTTKRPQGHMVTAHGNGCIGLVNTSAGLDNGRAITTDNGQNGSEVYDNLVVRGIPSSSNALGFANGAIEDLPAYMNFHDNVLVGVCNPGASYFPASSYAFPAQVHTTYGTNYTDDATGSGVASNVNYSALILPDPFANPDALAVACGYADRAALIAAALTSPEGHIQRNALATLRAGYGLS